MMTLNIQRGVTIDKYCKDLLLQDNKERDEIKKKHSFIKVKVMGKFKIVCINHHERDFKATQI